MDASRVAGSQVSAVFSERINHCAMRAADTLECISCAHGAVVYALGKDRGHLRPGDS